MSSRYKRKGKRKFVMIDSYMMKCEAWQQMTANDKAVYIELKWRYDGTNNGRIGLGAREAAEAIGKASKDTGKRSLDNLTALGIIKRTKLSGFNMKNRATSEWRLTEYKCDVTGALSTKEFMRWTCGEKTTVRPQGHTVRPQGQWDLKREVNHA